MCDVNLLVSDTARFGAQTESGQVKSATFLCSVAEPGHLAGACLKDRLLLQPR